VDGPRQDGTRRQAPGSPRQWARTRSSILRVVGRDQHRGRAVRRRRQRRISRHPISVRIGMVWDDPWTRLVAAHGSGVDLGRLSQIELPVPRPPVGRPGAADAFRRGETSTTAPAPVFGPDSGSTYDLRRPPTDHQLRVAVRKTAFPLAPWTSACPAGGAGLHRRVLRGLSSGAPVHRRDVAAPRARARCAPCSDGAGSCPSSPARRPDPCAAERVTVNIAHPGDGCRHSQARDDSTCMPRSMRGPRHGRSPRRA